MQRILMSLQSKQMFTVLFLSKSLLHFQMKAETIDSTAAVSLVKELKNITDPASPVVQFSGNLFAAVAILTRLGNKTAKNPPMNEEESKQFMEVSLKIEGLPLGSFFPCSQKLLGSHLPTFLS